MITPAGATPPVRGAGSPPMVLAEGLHKRYGRLQVLRGIDLEVARQEVMCIIGPSGSGKLTLLRCINHLEKINAAGYGFTVSWSATGSRAASSTSCASGKYARSGPRSAWSSSSSTCSRTRPRWRT